MRPGYDPFGRGTGWSHPVTVGGRVTWPRVGLLPGRRQSTPTCWAAHPCCPDATERARVKVWGRSPGRRAVSVSESAGVVEQMDIGNPVRTVMLPDREPVIFPQPKPQPRRREREQESERDPVPSRR